MMTYFLNDMGIFFIDTPKDLISKLLVVDPAKRFTVQQALNHDFFQVLVSILHLYFMAFTLFLSLALSHRY